MALMSKRRKVPSSLLWDPNSATNVRTDVLLHVCCAQMSLEHSLDNHYAYQKHFVSGIRSESAHDERECVLVCVCVSMSVALSLYPWFCICLNLFLCLYSVSCVCAYYVCACSLTRQHNVARDKEAPVLVSHTTQTLWTLSIDLTTTARDKANAAEITARLSGSASATSRR